MSRWAAASWLDGLLVALLLASLLIGSSGGSRLPAVSASDSSPDDELDSEEARNLTMPCDVARMRCAYRIGCGRALENYLRSCTSVMHGLVKDCPEVCQHALIALTSTDEGKELMKCDCSADDAMCRHSKQRAEVCRASVTKTMNRTRVSCHVATWICNADALCSTAMQYYNENCKRMFHGTKCTKRCRNSINILRRQEKAAKLNTCFCEGNDEYECTAIHRHMDELCFKRPAQQHKYVEEKEEADSGAKAASKPSGGYDSGDVRTKVPSAGVPAAGASNSASWSILLLGLVLLLHPTLGKQ